MNQQRLGRWARGVGGVCAGLGASACAATEGWAVAEHSAASPWWGLLVAAVALAGCVVDSSPRRDSGGEGGEGGGGAGGAGGGGAGGDGGGTPDVGPGGSGGGFWETCCLSDGTISECLCEGGGSCNYGWFEVCADGRCTYSFDCDQDMGPPDVGPPDVGPPDVGPPDVGPPEGEWEACCNDGTVSTCSCPVGAECNYGWFTPCADGACGFETCLESDPTIFHQVCCRDGQLTTCACREGEACQVNGERYQACAGGACVDVGAACP